MSKKVLMVVTNHEKINDERPLEFGYLNSVKHTMNSNKQGYRGYRCKPARREAPVDPGVSVKMSHKKF